MKDQLRLWVFAYDMDNMKPRGFYSTEMPFAAMPTELEKEFFDEVLTLQRLAHDMAKQVRTQVKKAWFKRSDDAKGDFGFIDLMFWQRTEPVFFQAVNALAEQANSKPEELIMTTEMARRWLLAMQAISLEIFDELVLASEPEPREMSEKIQARNILRGWLYRSKKPIQQFKTDYNIASEQTQGVSA